MATLRTVRPFHSRPTPQGLGQSGSKKGGPVKQQPIINNQREAERSPITFPHEKWNNGAD